MSGPLRVLPSREGVMGYKRPELLDVSAADEAALIRRVIEGQPAIRVIVKHGKGSAREIVLRGPNGTLRAVQLAPPREGDDDLVLSGYGTTWIVVTADKRIVGYFPGSEIQGIWACGEVGELPAAHS